MFHRRTLIKGMALAPLAYGALKPFGAGADAAPAILTVSGAIKRSNTEAGFEFDRAALEGLGVTTLRTSTAWTAQPPLFEGVLASDVLDAVGAHGGEVVAIALNDYLVNIPIDDFYRYPVLLATKMNGQYLKVRDKGPLWIVYPRDQFAELSNPLTDKKWIWQLSRLEIR